MKATIHLTIILYLFIATTACDESRVPQTLVTADSMCRHDPDSAVALLKSIRKDTADFSEEARMYYRLLNIQANDKTDVLKPESETGNIAEIIDYYEKHDNKRLLALAYYYGGRIYAELQNAPLALEFLQNAKNTLKEDEDLDLSSRIYSQMGYLFYYQEVYDESLNMFIKAYKCNKQSNDTSAIIYELRDISTSYEAQKKYDKAIKYLKDAYSLAKEYKNKYMLANIGHYKSSLYLVSNKPDSAMKYAQESLRNIAITDSSSVYSLIMDVYNSQKNQDSVLYYCKQLERIGKVYAKEAAYRNLTEIYLERGDNAEANRCFKMHKIYADSVKAIKRTDVIARMNAMYNYQEKEKENIMLNEKNSRNMIIIIFSSITAIILMMTFILYIRYNRMKREELLSQYKRSKQLLYESIRTSEEHINENQIKINELEALLKQSDSEKVELRKELEREKERLISENTIALMGIKERNAAAEVIKSSPIYRHFCNMAEKGSGILPSDDDWTRLETLINREYQDFTDRLNSLCRISKQELHASMLVKIDIEPRKIAALLCCSYSNASTIRSRLYKKVFGQKGSSKEWDKFIKSL